MAAKTKRKKVAVDDEDEFERAVFARMQRSMPRKDDGTVVEVTMTEDGISSGIDYVLTTGIDSYDEIVGGMPFGRIIELYGLEGCGKTAMAIRCAIRAKMKHIRRVRHHLDESRKITFEDIDPKNVRVTVVYVDNEASLDNGKIMVDGVPLKCIVVKADTIDQVFKKCAEAITTAEEFENRDDGKLHFTVIVIDTIASTSSKEELSQEWGKRDFPRLPAEISKGFSKLVRRINRSNVCMICTNQVRTNYKAAQNKGPMAGNDDAFDYTSMGGMALRFYASHRVFMKAVSNRYKLKPTSQFAAGIKVRFRSIKNRLRPPQREGDMVLLTSGREGGLHNVYSMLETLIRLKYIEVAKQSGIDFTVKFNKHGIVPKTFRSEDVDRSLDEEDDLPKAKRRRKKEPGFKYRSEWPAFYQEHEEDIAALWQKAIDHVLGSDNEDDTDEPLDEEALAEEMFDEND